MPEHPWSVVFKFEVVLGGGSQFISGARIRLEGHLSLVRLTHISNENLCADTKSASVSSRSIFAFVLDTVNRIPVNILYAVTQLTWFWSTLVPTITLSSSSSSFRFLLLALFCLIASVHRAASSSCGTSSRCRSECTDRVVRRTSPNDALLVRSTVGENLPPPSASSEVLGFDREKSREPRVGANLGTWRVCRCVSRWRSG
jgi:hypothetical protein